MKILRNCVFLQLLANLLYTLSKNVKLYKVIVDNDNKQDYHNDMRMFIGNPNRFVNNIAQPGK